MWLSAAAASFAALALISAGCVGPTHGAPATSPGASAPRDDVRVSRERPPVAVVVREGDPRSAVAVVVSTAGVSTADGAGVAVALSALTLARLRAKGLTQVAVTPGWDEYRVRALVTSATEAAALVDTVRGALLAPLAPDAPELALVQQRLLALTHRPMADPALYDAVRCTDEPFSMPAVSAWTAPSPATIEAWRARAHMEGRVALAAVGDAATTEAVAAAIANGPAWPRPAAATPGAAETSGSAGDRPERAADVYDAPDLPPGTARVTLAIHTSRPEQAVAAAAELGDPRGALATRLGALDSPARLLDVTATAHPHEGCLAVTLLFAARYLGSDAAARIATAVALARQEVVAELADARADASLGRTIAARQGDPRDAAETAAWWTLIASGERPAGATDGPRVSVAVGLASRRGSGTSTASSTGIRSELDRATVAWHVPVVEARSRVETGQGELWLLLASPCGTLEEDDADAGLGAVVALATAERATLRASGSAAAVEGWATTDGLGVIAHGPALPGESRVAQARRLADVAARSFAADSLDADAVMHARGTLLGLASGESSRGFSALAGALAPGHPSWTAPLGTAEALGRSSDAAVAARASALRAGPLRVAVLANGDAAQSEAAVRAVDRWVARRPGEVRACPPVTTAAPARPGTYAVEIPGATSSEGWLALSLPGDDPASYASATLLAAAMDGEDGLLAQVLGTGFARAWSARVVGPLRAPALVIRISSVQAALDGAIAQTRALLERLRQEAITGADRARGLEHLRAQELDAALDPKNRLLALWRGEPKALTVDTAPSLEALRTFAAATLRDESLVLVAPRPPRDAHPPQRDAHEEARRPGAPARKSP